MFIKKIVSFFFIIFVGLSRADCLNLQDLSQPDLVLQSKQIIIPEYPHAFNPSIIRWNNKLLLSFRIIPDPKQTFISYIGIIWLNDNFEPITTPQLLPLRNSTCNAPSRAEDGRLIAIKDHLYLVYTDNENPTINKGGFRMYIAELTFNNDECLLSSIERISSFEGNNSERREKNWVPFDYYSKLLLAYSICPHKIFYYLFGTGSCETFVSTCFNFDWDWGDVRGGTPALLDGNHYLAFFHSSKWMKTVQSKEKEKMHYFMGAYTFNRDYPFNITRVSSQPIISNQVNNAIKRFYVGAEYKPYWGSVMAVFPCGFIMDSDFIWLTFGRQDHEMWVAKLDKKKLYESLVPVVPAKKRMSW